MHFNTEGISDLMSAEQGITSYRDFAIYNGNRGGDYMTPGQQIQVDGRSVTFYATAWELHRIASDSALCNKTYFYERGTQNTVSSASLKLEICSML